MALGSKKQNRDQELRNVTRIDQTGEQHQLRYSTLRARGCRLEHRERSGATSADQTLQDRKGPQN